MERIGALLVLKPNGDIAGIISERDIVRAVGVNGRRGDGPTGGGADDQGSHLLHAGRHGRSRHGDDDERRFRHLPVRQGGKIVAMISIGDVVKTKVEEAEAESQAMREYIARG